MKSHALEANRKDQKTGYYLAAKPTYLGKRERLHVYVWRSFNGDIPAGCHIHHKDENKDNNDISNLECMARHDHLSYHTKKRIEEDPEFSRVPLEKARERAKEWHRSDAGREWHKKHALAQDIQAKTFTCQYCGKQFEALPCGSVKYCSNNCKARARYHSGVDNETRKCSVCGCDFIANKYSATRCCSRKCAGILRSCSKH